MSQTKPISCADCGGFDFEWMYRCDVHRADYCRGCSCPGCDEDVWTDDDDPGAECGRWDNGRLTHRCSKAGSEECDFECPYRDSLYKSTAK